MTDHIRHRQAQNIADVVMHHTHEVNELIGLYKQQAASLDQLTDIMARVLEIDRVRFYHWKPTLAAQVHSKPSAAAAVHLETTIVGF